MSRNLLAPLMIVIGFLVYSCREEGRETKIEVPLNSSWKFRETENNIWYPAHVPGALTSDIEQINSKGENVIFDLSKIHKANWEYATHFDVSNDILTQDVVQLCFKELSARADIYLNDSLVLKANSRFRSWSINCKHRLKAKDNQLKILFHHEYGRNNWHHHTTDSFPKDHGKNTERLSSIGIWQPIYLEAWSFAKIDDLNLTPDSVLPKKAVYTAHVSLTSVVNQNFDLEFLINNKPTGKLLPISLKKGANTFQARISVEKPKLWWPNGMGNPNLYTVTVRLKSGQTIIQEKHQKLGIRTIEVVNRLNSPDQSCYIKLNGIPVFIKGARFSISSFLPIDTVKRIYAQTIENARESNFNMLRISDKEVQDDSFYDLCDENGILIWQDLQVNPGWGPKTNVNKESKKQDIIENLKQIRKHPCLTLWLIKDQETEVDCCERKTLPDSVTDKKSPDLRQTTDIELLTSMVKEYGYSSQYLIEPKSNKNTTGIDLFNGQLMGNFAINYGIPRSQQCRTTGNNLPNMEKSNIGDYIQKNFGLPGDPKSENYMSRLAQAEIMKSIIENHRINMPRCMGSLYEQMNESKKNLYLPTIDPSGKWAPAQYAVKDAFSHILVVPVYQKDKVNIYAVSDAFKNLDAILLVRLIDFQGKDLFVRQIPVEIEANVSSILMTLKESELLKHNDRTKCCLVVQLNQATKTLSQNILYFTEFKNLKLPEPLIDLNINDAGKGYNIILKSSVLMKNIFIQTVSKVCLFSDNNFDLLPGKRTKIHISYNGTRDELLKDIRICSFADFN
jgi:beta-mannosidase